MKVVVAIALLLSFAGAYKVLQLPPVEANSYQQKRLEVNLDHFDPNEERTFSLRYWINYDHWTEDSDVILLYVCGESACHAPSSSQFPQQVGASLNALLISLEHRYYGDSQPFSNEEGGWSTENLQYLTSEQALADIAYFIDTINLQLQDKGVAKKQRWMVVGGSYPGAVVAWFKSQYPEHAHIAWSSSGVINAIEDFTDYDLDMYLATSKSGEECPRIIQSITAYLDSVISDASQGQSLDEYQEIKALFNAEEVADAQFMFFIADTVAGAVQYGQRSSLCDFILSLAELESMDQVKAFHDYSGDIDIETYDLEYLVKTEVSTSSSMRQWMYQFCNEFGWFQTPNPTHPMRSKLVDMPFQVYQCSVAFGHYLRPNVAGTNAHYGGLDIQGKNIVFANAAEDPWQYAAMKTIHDPTTQSGMKSVYIDCDDCAHCVDLGTPHESDPVALTEAREEIYNQILEWLREDSQTQLVQ